MKCGQTVDVVRTTREGRGDKGQRRLESQMYYDFALFLAARIQTYNKS